MSLPVIDVVESCNNLRRLCAEKGISVNDLRKALGLESVQACYKWFAGKNLPSIDNLFIIAQLLGVRIDDIIVTKEVDIKEKDERDF